MAVRERRRGRAHPAGAAGDRGVDRCRHAPCTTTVRARRGTLPDEAVVREWLGEQEEELIEAARNGPVIVQ